MGFILPGGTAAEQLELSLLAERAGWDGVFVWEAAYGIDAWTLLAAIAVRTTRVRLGTLLTSALATTLEGREPGGHASISCPKAERSSPWGWEHSPPISRSPERPPTCVSAPTVSTKGSI